MRCDSQPVFDGMFKGLLTLFLLEMGLAAGSRLGDLKKAGVFLLGFGILMPILVIDRDCRVCFERTSRS